MARMGRGGFEAYAANDHSLGLFPRPREAAAAIIIARPWVARTTAPVLPLLGSTTTGRVLEPQGRSSTAGFAGHSVTATLKLFQERGETFRDRLLDGIVGPEP
jgi:hypothetical protein